MADFRYCASLNLRPRLALELKSAGFPSRLSPTDISMRRWLGLSIGLVVAAPDLIAQAAPLRDASAAKSADAAAPVGALRAWLNVGGQLRARAEAYTNGGFRPDNSDQYILTRVLLHARVQPTRA